MLMRALRHLFTIDWMTRRRFGPEALSRIEAAIEEVEGRHAGEIRVAIETSLDLPELWRRVTARQRALEVFGHLGVWDTEQNNGVLIYILMAERDVEVVADRGIGRRVPQSDWDQVCRDIQVELAAGRYGEGVAAGVRDVGGILARHFPGDRGDRDELPNRPVLL
jgi:uncharacterized membrane protein